MKKKGGRECLMYNSGNKKLIVQERTDVPHQNQAHKGNTTRTKKEKYKNQETKKRKQRLISEATEKKRAQNICSSRKEEKKSHTWGLSRNSTLKNEYPCRSETFFLNLLAKLGDCGTRGPRRG